MKLARAAIKKVEFESIIKQLPIFARANFQSEMP